MPEQTSDSPQIVLHPIGHIRCSRKQPLDDNWSVESTAIELEPGLFSTESLAGLSEFSHIEVVFFMDGVAESERNRGSRHPRGDSKYPLTGVFAQRGRNRPNPLGLTVCRIKSIDGLRLEVQDCDAIDGSPVLDIKPYVCSFGPKGKVSEPRWMQDLMNDYWQKDLSQSTDPALGIMIADAIKERRLENKDKALEILEHAKQHFPKTPLVDYQIGWTHDVLGRKADALDAYKQSIELGVQGKDRLELFIGLSSTLRSLGRYLEALEVIDQACAENPQDLVTKVFRSLVLNNLHRGDEAIGELLNVLLDSTTDCQVRKYARSLEFYSIRLREVFA